MVIHVCDLSNETLVFLSQRVDLSVKSSFYGRLLKLKSVCGWNTALNVTVLEKFRIELVLDPWFSSAFTCDKGFVQTPGSDNFKIAIVPDAVLHFCFSGP